MTSQRGESQEAVLWLSLQGGALFATDLAFHFALRVFGRLLGPVDPAGLDPG